jgi:hypothetical protein
MSSLYTCTLPVYLHVNFIRRATMYNKIGPTNVQHQQMDWNKMDSTYVNTKE